MSFDHYIRAGSRMLRCGFTTGTCAALASAGAANRLITGEWPQTVSLRTPKGWTVEVGLEDCHMEGDAAVCAVRKDGGDDIDQTNGVLIQASVRLSPIPGIRIDGGTGVGRVTRPGLDQPVGAAAINRIPRIMITDAVEEVLALSERETGAQILISVPQGGAIADRTFNPHLGIEGGISILGTSGIVEPMSTQALVDTIGLELRQIRESGSTDVILVPGNYGMEFLNRELPHLRRIPMVKCSNFIGDSLDEISLLGFSRVLLVGHIGKLVKLAGGIMNTHSRVADCRGELFCAYAAALDAGRDLCHTLLSLPTADACLSALEQAGLREGVISALLDRIQFHLDRRSSGECRTGALVFSNEFGLLGTTATGETILQEWQSYDSVSEET